MSRKSKRKQTKLQSVTEPPQIRTDAAGIDISPEVIYAAVDPRKDPQPIRHYGTVTAELYRIANWLQACGVRTVAMESTGVYWIPLYQVLDERGFEVYLVNARHYKNVPGRKTDVCDSAWLQYLHAVGLLQGSFRPADQICAFRTVMRHRGSLVEAASKHVQHMQKALDQMNVQIHRVLSDVTGVSGLAMLDAILAGERDPRRLAELRDGRVKATEESIIGALEGNYRTEHLFTLKQSLESYRHYQKLIAECDRQIREQLEGLDGRSGGAEAPAARKNMRTRSDEELRKEFFRIVGVDLTAIPSINVGTVQVMLAEVGPDLTRFRSAGAFSNWLGLCPNNSITGGKIQSSKTKETESRLAAALRMAAESLCRDKSYLGQVYRRMKMQLSGGAEAVTAAAHKLARIIWAMVTHQVEYDETRFAEIEQKHRERSRLRFIKQAEKFGFRLTPIQPAAGFVS
jgi:Transposase IS116/IS110/IS902 family./Transposase.